MTFILKRRKLRLRATKVKLIVGQHFDPLEAFPPIMLLFPSLRGLPCLVYYHVTVDIYVLIIIFQKDQGLRGICKWRRVYFLFWKDNVLCSENFHIWKIKDTSADVFFSRNKHCHPRMHHVMLDECQEMRMRTLSGERGPCLISGSSAPWLTAFGLNEKTEWGAFCLRSLLSPMVE